MAAHILPKVSAGMRFGRWLVISAATSRFYRDKSKASLVERKHWHCRCDCGTERDVSELNLKNGRSAGCGCSNVEASVEANLRHGETLGGKSTSEYTAWKAMHSRCRNPNNKRFEHYGGRGIDVCERWRVFENFLTDMGRRPTSQHSLDRIDNDLGYEPGNCRWAIPHVQMTNRTVTRFVEVDGSNVPIATLAKRNGIPANTLRSRILNGWSLDDALNRPVRPKAKSG